MARHTYDPGGDYDGALTVEIFRSYGQDKVTLDIERLGMVPLTAEEARSLAADLVKHAEILEGRGA